MKGKVTKVKKYFILLVAVITLMMSSMTVFASSISTAEAETALKIALQRGSSSAANSTSYAGNQYRIDGGGYATWTELYDAGSPQTGYVNEQKFNTLTADAKRAYLENMLTVSNDVVDSTTGNEAGVSNTTQTSWLNNLQNCSGVGSQLMTTLLANTKPDYVIADRVLKPFSGVAGTILGIGSILLMACIAITMLLDLSYIGVPLFRMFCDGDDTGQGGNSGAKFISHEAKSAIQLAEGNSGNSAQQGGSNKVAVGLYFKKRAVMLIALGICLLYLVQGQIFVLVGWILDLASGFLGF